MKHVLRFLLLTLVTLQVHGQGLTAVGIHVSPSFTRPTGIDYEYIDIPFTFAYGFGITGTFPLSPKVLFRTGIGYTLKRDLFKDIPDTRDLMDENGNINYDKIIYFDAYSNLSYINIPAIFTYKTAKDADQKSSFIISGGLDINYFYKGKTVLQYADGDVVYTWTPDEFTLNLGAVIRAGWMFNLSEKMFLFAEPGYCYDFYASNNGSTFHSLFLSAELNYRLK